MNPETAKMIYIRKTLLTTLNVMFPSPLTMKTLMQAIIPIDRHYNWILLEKDMTYLQEEDYVEYISNKLIGDNIPFQDKAAKITTKGKKFVEGTIKDEALEI